MKTKFAILLLSLVFMAPALTQAQTATSNAKKVEVYYFHFEKRCATCNAVEAVTKETLAAYGEKTSFTSVNLDESSGAAIGKKMNVNEQTLLLIGNNKKVDLTNDAFLYARSNPDKLKKIIREKTDSLLK